MADTSRADEPVLLFTGGSLLVGAVGRTDLLGAGARAPVCPGDVPLAPRGHPDPQGFRGVYPTHGAGSLCSTGISSTPWSTIGFERRHNPMLQPADVDAFASRLLDGQPGIPRYFARMRPTNQAGPSLLGGHVPAARPMSVEEVDAAIAGDAQVVDLRRPADFAAEHVPGSLSIPAGSSFGTWLGWVVDHERPIVLLLDDAADWDDAIRQALRIGYERVVGHLRGGFRHGSRPGATVESSGGLHGPPARRRLRDGARRAPGIDVRQPASSRRGTSRGPCTSPPASCRPAGGAASGPADRHDLRSGYRSSVAASLLRRAGFRDVSWVADGLPAWEAAGLPVTAGEAGGEARPMPAATQLHR